MKKSFVRVVSLVGALALPAGLIAQAKPSATTTTTVDKSTTKMETKTTDKGTVKTKKSRRHHKKTRKSQAAKPSASK